MRHLGLKIGCLVVSILIWAQVAYNYQIEETLSLPVRIVNLPEGATAAGNDVPEQVRVRVRGSKLLLMAHQYLGRDAGRVEVDLAGVEPGPPIHRDITVNDVRSAFDVLAVSPPVRLRLRVDREGRRRVPVDVVLSGSLPAEHQLDGPPEVEPDSVSVTGPERFLDLERVRTAPVDLSRIRETTSLLRPLVLPNPGLVADRDEARVTVRVSLAELRRFAHLPVVPLVDADQGAADVFPPVADVTISGPADSVRALLPARIAVTLPLSGLGEGTHRLAGQVVLPEGYRLVGVEPEVFTVVIGGGADGREP